MDHIPTLRHIPKRANDIMIIGQTLAETRQQSALTALT
jgi:hypothetical protein